MHINTHLKPESVGKTGLGVYPDGMVEHDGMVGQILDKLKALGLEENTIVMYSTDNGAEVFGWPDGGTTPFRGEKNDELGGWLSRALPPSAGPASSSPAPCINDLFAHEDMIPTIMAAAGVPDVKEQLLKGMKVGDKTFKVHLDGYNITDALAGKGPSPRHEFFYWNDDGSLVALRYDNWKIVFAGAARRRLRRLAGSVRAAAPAQDLQSALRSVRDGRSGRHRLRQVADRPHVPAGAGAAVSSGSSSPRSRSFRRARRSAASSLDQVLETLQKGGGRLEGPHSLHCGRND